MHQQFPRRALRTATFLRSGELTAIVQGSPTTISRRAQAGRLPHPRTLEGYRRSPATAIHQLAASPVQEVRAR
jgi:hypothetical protein